MDETQQLLAGISQSLGLEAFPGRQTAFLITYDYVESGVRERCGFICQKASVREAAESFWNQHPGE